MKADIRWLDDPQVFRVNRLDAHSDHKFYENKEDYEKKEQRLKQSLNGIWKFRYSENAMERPADFYQKWFQCRSFDEMKVPQHIELAGYDKIHYINTMYPWEGHIYRRPAETGKEKGKGMFSQAEYNPVGSYIRKFDLQDGLRGKRIILSFEGVEQAFYVWVNGEFAGYAEDSFTVSEFDITPYVKEKDNLLAVEVHKRSTAAFLEDQDFFRFFGIFRDVNLYGIPAVHIEDLWIRPIYHPEDGKAEIELDIRLSQKKKEKNIRGKIKVSLKDNAAETKTVLLDETENLDDPAIQTNLPVEGSVNNVLHFRYELKKTVNAWSNTDPYLYELLIEVQNEKDETVEVVPYPIGFRKIELKDGKMLLNGKRLIINGVNRHEWNARSGRCITEADEKWDIECIRRNHINAVRTCHYPDHISWYYRCDQAGIYLMAETNLETHGSWQKMGATEPSWNVPGNIECWRACTLDRAVSNFETFKNHTSVLFWSLGNESYAGNVLREMNQYYKEKDPDRLVHYEGVCHNRSYEDVISDMESQMYTSPENVKEYLENNPKKPFLLCEYMHDMGNSLGGMESYIRLLDQYDNYQGGFIWDYMDQALWVKDEVTGREVLRYGGDFDDRPSDYEFSGNGILFADRTEKPAMQEVRHYYGLRR
ncbi:MULTISPECIES: glycoside hydrolase family 2 TIM barrel-domain containing protein [Dorea]|uniref:glycoside hydrolase family 2 TIM barrel-domain containing protein n=1 Tax=Dorea TaxID=189330 RepID=UPI000E4CCDCF|nr:glycoside hydrolase family 2 TIM barrel-domain containing protein [Dorea longicatena]RGU07325.1 beta-galactosidase [Dorea longicatena]